MRLKYLGRWLAGLMLLLMPLQVFAATRTWDAGGGTDTKWSTAANWSSNTAPTGADIALFDGTGKTNAVVDGSFGGSINQLQVTSSFTGTITVGRSLTVSVGVALTGGTLQLNGGNRIIDKGYWRNDGTTFTSNTGTVVLAGTGTIRALKESNAFYVLAINDGLAGYWKFDETSGSTAADSSGNGNNGTLTGSSGTNNKPQPSTNVPTTGFSNPRSLNFDGTDDRVDLPNSSVLIPASTTEATASAWIYPTDFSDENRIITLTSNGSNSILALLSGRVVGKFSAFARNSSNGLIQIDSSSTYTANAWYHVAVTVSGSSGVLYVNGTNVGSSSSVSILKTLQSMGANAARVGTGPALDAEDFFPGLVDDVRIYRRALSPTDIARLAAGNQPFTSSGTYTLQGNLDVNGSLLLASGTLDISSSNYAIAASGSWLNYGGIFRHRSGTVTFDGKADVLQSGSKDFYAVSITSSSGVTLYDNGAITSSLSVGANSILSLQSYTLTASSSTVTNSGRIYEGNGKIVHPSSSFSVTASLTIGSSIGVSITDTDGNLSGTAQDTLAGVRVGGESLTLTETTNTSGVFQGSIATAHGSEVASNGIIEHEDACSFFVDADYRDAQDSSDGASGRTEVSDPAVPCEIAGSGAGGGHATAAGASHPASASRGVSTAQESSLSFVKPLTLVQRVKQRATERRKKAAEAARKKLEQARKRILKAKRP